MPAPPVRATSRKVPPCFASGGGAERLGPAAFGAEGRAPSAGQLTVTARERVVTWPRVRPDGRRDDQSPLAHRNRNAGFHALLAERGIVDLGTVPLPNGSGRIPTQRVRARGRHA